MVRYDSNLVIKHRNSLVKFISEAKRIIFVTSKMKLIFCSLVHLLIVSALSLGLIQSYFKFIQNVILYFKNLNRIWLSSFILMWIKLRQFCSTRICDINNLVTIKVTEQMFHQAIVLLLILNIKNITKLLTCKSNFKLINRSPIADSFRSLATDKQQTHHLMIQ